MKELIGKEIKAIRINGDSTVVVFYTDSGPVAYEVTGDCCSHSWFEHFTNVKEVIGETVSDVIEREMGEATDAKENQDCVKCYGYAIKHTGIIPLDIEFRNESNGYYGGSCDLTTEIPVDLKPLTEDK